MSYFCVHCQTENPDPYPGAKRCVQCGRDMTGGAGADDDPVGVGCLLTTAFWVVVLATPVVALLVVTSWWTLLGGPLRRLLELLPDGVVARAPGGGGRPVAVGAGVLLLVLVLVAALSRKRRRAVREAVLGGVSVRAWWWALTRSVVLVAGLPLALVAGVVASGGDLRPGARSEAWTAWWQVAAVVALVVAHAGIGTHRLASRLGKRRGSGPYG